MFVLRSIIKHASSVKSTDGNALDKIQTNQIIGDNYNLIESYESHEEFDKLASEFPEDYKEKVFGFIVCNHGGDIIPLFKERDWYIMTESGKTFSRLR